MVKYIESNLSKMKQIFIFIRCGDTIPNSPNSERRLSESALDRAHQLKQKIEKLGYVPNKIFISPTVRAKEMAQEMYPQKQHIEVKELYANLSGPTEKINYEILESMKSFYKISGVLENIKESIHFIHVNSEITITTDMIKKNALKMYEDVKIANDFIKNDLAMYETSGRHKECVTLVIAHDGVLNLLGYFMAKPWHDHLHRTLFHNQYEKGHGMIFNETSFDYISPFHS